MKRFLLALTVLMVGITAAFAEVYSGKCGTNVTYTLDTETGVLKIEGTGAMNNYASGENGYGTPAPWRKHSFRSVTISQGVTRVGSYAFYCCYALSSITIPNSVESIGEWAFANNSMTSITIPNSVKYIGDYAFVGCSLASVTIPSSVTYIGRSVFEHCTSLASVTIPESVTGIGNSAFYGCSSLASITIPSSVTSIEGYAFYNCSSLASITIVGSVTSIGEKAFKGCSSLASIILPESVTSIGTEAFNGCSSLTSITLPKSVTSIGTEAFYGCYCIAVNVNNDTAFNLESYGLTTYDAEQTDGLLIKNKVAVFCRPWATSIIIPNSVTSIGQNAFKDCNLKSLTVGTGVVSISSSAFTFRPTKTIWLTNTPPTGYQYARGTVNYVANDLYTNLSNTKKYPLLSSLFVVDGVKYALVSTTERTCDVIDCTYDDTENIKIGPTVTYKNVKLTVKNINEYSLAFNRKIRTVDIENDGKVGNHAFYGCSGLQLATINNNGELESEAFNGCSGLQKALIFNSGYIGESAFEGSFKNSSDTSFVHVECTSDIQQSAFKNCSGIRTLEVMNGGSVGDNAFYGCSGLQKAIISNAGYIGASAFENSFKNASDTTFVHIECASDIRQNAFKNCFGIRTLEVMNGGVVGDSAFYDCSGLQLATILNKGNIGTSAFENAFKVDANSSSVYVANEGWVGNAAFRNSTGLKNIEIRNKGYIGSTAFYGCSGLQKAVISNAGYIGASAFYGCSELQKALISNTGYIGESAFEESFKNASDTSFVHIESTSDIQQNAFKNCSGLKTLEVMNGGAVGSNAFYGCSNLQSATIKNNGDIGTSAFQDAFKVATEESCVLIENKGNIGSNAFKACSGLQTAHIKNTGIIGANAFEGAFSAKIGASSAHIENGSYIDVSAFTSAGLKYAFINNKGDIKDNSFYSSVNLDSVEINNTGKVAISAFDGCSKLRVALLGQTVTGLGNYAFRGCKMLEKTIIPDSVLSLGEYCFDGCTSLTYAKIGNGVPTISQYAFQNCGLKAIEIGTGVKTIALRAFSGCSSLPEINIPQNVTSIGNYVFAGCSKLSLVSIKDRTATLALGSNGSSALFSACSLDSVYLGGKITYNTGSGYGYSPFYRNLSLRSVRITDVEDTIYDNEFYGCTGLQHVRIGDGVTTIGKWAFSGCSSLLSFSYGSGLQSIGQEAFSDCVGVTKLVSNADTPPVCGSQALEDISKWECTLYVPAESIDDYQEAEQWRDFFFMEATFSRGDANHDKKVNLLDVEAIKNHILSVTPLPLENGDINENGEICIADIAKVIEICKTPINVTSITLSETTLELDVDELHTLTATIAPKKASNPEVIWASNNSGVVVVSKSGNITALSYGTATITCSAADGSGVVATCEVRVAKPSDYNGHDYVDLGLPSGIKWATCNVGANNPEDYGGYYAWGETETKSTYSWSTYKWCNGSSTTMTKYCTRSSYGIVDKKTTLDLEDDVAHVKWGGDWRMPTWYELEELRDTDNCTWTWTTQGGKNGYLVTSKKNGNSIFLPASGYRYSRSLSDAGSDGDYWTSSLDDGIESDADQFFFNSSEVCEGYYMEERCYGLSVRPVCPSSLVSVTSITLNTASMEITEGESSQLSATISPTNATNKNITWSSSNTNVATVSNTGLVTAKAVGSATITAAVTDGSEKMSTCTVKVRSIGFVHEYVDLGLPSGIKWATCNLGADSPEDYGDYYAWGETGTKDTYDWDTYKWCNGSETTLTKYCTSSSYGTVDNKTTLGSEDDVAHAKWGGNWRMPTDAEFAELIDTNNCTWTWTTQGGKNGYLVTSKKNGNSIFLPAAGFRWGSKLVDAGSGGYYGSCSLPLRSWPHFSGHLEFDSDELTRGGYCRCYGQSVRPVCP